MARTPAFQADDASSILVARSTKGPHLNRDTATYPDRIPAPVKTTVTPVDQADLDALSESAEDAPDGAEEQQERAFGPESNSPLRLTKKLSKAQSKKRSEK